MRIYAACVRVKEVYYLCWLLRCVGNMFSTTSMYNGV
jgi:hypothetical protein